jgi:hypothetical protein
MPKSTKPVAAPAADYFHATGAQLREMAAAGDTGATAEIDRRAAKRAAKRGTAEPVAA